MDELSISNFKIYKMNPFIEKICDQDLIQRKDGTKLTPTSVRVSDTNGKFIGSALVREKTSKYYDTRDFVRLTNEGIILMSGLQLVEHKVLSYILLFLKHNDLEIELSVDKIKLYYNYTSRNPIYKGIIGLLSYGVISRKECKKPIYFINPLYFYKGTIVKDVFNHINENGTAKQQELLENVDFYNQK